MYIYTHILYIYIYIYIYYYKRNHHLLWVQLLSGVIHGGAFGGDRVVLELMQSIRRLGAAATAETPIKKRS